MTTIHQHFGETSTKLPGQGKSLICSILPRQPVARPASVSFMMRSGVVSPRFLGWSFGGWVEDVYFLLENDGFSHLPWLVITMFTGIYEYIISQIVASLFF